MTAVLHLTRAKYFLILKVSRKAPLLARWDEGKKVSLKGEPMK
jgi:hypothetical protein